MFRIIHNMLNGIKSCVRKDGSFSDSYLCNTGVRQGKHLSHTLFSLYLNDWKNL